MKKKLLLAAVAVAGLSFGQVHAAPVVIDFDAFPQGSFTGTLGTEDGITVSATGGSPFIDNGFVGGFGNPGNGFFNDAVTGTSTFSFVGGGTFTFDTLDIIGGLFSAGFGDVTVKGYLGGFLLCSDTFTPTSSFSTVSAFNLAGVAIDRVDVLMPEFGVSADTLVLTVDPVAATQNLIDLIESLFPGGGAASGVKKPLLKQLNNIIKKVEQNQLAVACAMLDDFLCLVCDKEANGQLSATNAADIRVAEQWIRAGIGCSPPPPSCVGPCS